MWRKEEKHRKSGMAGQTQSSLIYKFAGAAHVGEAHGGEATSGLNTVSAKKAGEHRSWAQGRERCVCKKAGIHFPANFRLGEGKSELPSCRWGAHRPQ